MDVLTGSEGFIGGHLKKALLSTRDIFTLDLNATIPMDIRKPVLALGSVDTIYHLAALSNIIPSITNPRDYYETNVTGTFNVLEAARLAGARKFVYAASASCYGETPARPVHENSLCNPAYPYALTKYLGEQLVMHYGKVYGMDVVSLRLFNVYGPRSLTKSAYGAMFNTFLAQKANGKPLTIVGDGTQSRDFTYVDDVVDALILAAEKGAGIINVGTGKPTSINRVAEIIGGETVSIQERGGEPYYIYADNTKLKALGWEPKTSIEQGIANMMENLDYWKNAKVWEPDAIAEQTKEWQACLGK